MTELATVNKNLEKLTENDIIKVSERYLMGWHDLEKEFGFRIKGLNNKRQAIGLPFLDKNVSMEYRLDYIRTHYSQDEIYDTISDCLRNSRVAEDRWKGIELFNCRFGRDYVTAFRQLIGSSEYRKLSEENRVEKLKETQLEIYGGIGLAGESAKKKALLTNMTKYGVSNPMYVDAIKEKLGATNSVKYDGISPFSSEKIQEKANENKMKIVYSQLEQFRKDGEINNIDCFKSEGEKIVFCELVSKFGRYDVFYQYGLHPYDKRYPFHCDFYIKSLDLFIELNAHYSHHTHWYDANNPDDLLRKNNMLASGKKRSINAIKVWCETDVNKRNYAKKNKLRYLVFWDGSSVLIKNKNVPQLKDFYLWFNEYDCDVDSFLNDNPSNTY